MLRPVRPRVGPGSRESAKEPGCPSVDVNPRLIALEGRNAALQHCGMSTTIPLTKRGSLTLPPALRRKLGFDRLRNPMVLIEEREGGLFLQPAVAMAVRDLPKKQIAQWIARDEADMTKFLSTPRKLRLHLRAIAQFERPSAR